jgi:hypothetical protein
LNVHAELSLRRGRGASVDHRAYPKRPFTIS